MPEDWAVALLLLLMAPAVGSFLGVLVDRLPSGGDIMRAPSSCAACGARLGWRDLVPILSHLALGGRCRHCAAAIPQHLLRIEIAALLTTAIAVARTAGTVELALTVLALWCLVGLFYFDLLHYRLPNVLTGPLLLCGLALAALDPLRGLQAGLASAAAGFLAFWLLSSLYLVLRRREGLGRGDLKLIAGVGAALGWQMLPWVTLLASILGLGAAAVDALRRHAWPRGDARLPFGAYLSAAAAVFLLL